jgi:Neuron-derived Neurotrophic Factor C-terminal
VNVSTPLTSTISKAGRLAEGRETHILLTAKHPVKWLEYTQREHRRRYASYNISFYFRSCRIDTDVFPVTVTVERRQGGRSQPWVQLVTSVIGESFQSLSVSGSKPGTFRLRMEIDAASSDRSENGRRRLLEAVSRVQSRWTILVVTNDVDDPYPVLPRNLTIQVVDDDENSTACRHSVTLAWTLAAVRPTQRYCLYATELTSLTTERPDPDTCTDLSRRTSNLASKSRKISCKVVAGTEIGTEGGNERRQSGVDDGTAPGDERHESLMIQTVSGLKAGRRYAFNVQTMRLPDDKNMSFDSGNHFRVYNRLVTSSTAAGC